MASGPIRSQEVSFLQVKVAIIGERWNALIHPATPGTELLGEMLGFSAIPEAAWAWWFASLNHPWSMMDGEVIVTSNQADIRFDVPLYTVAEAARALGVHPSTLSTWAKGYVRQSPGRQPVRGEAIVTSLESDHGQPSIPFVGLAEALVLAGIRKSGVPLQRVRPALAALSREIGIEHALASRRLFTDGAEILFDHAAALSSDEAEVVRELVVVRSGQRVFAKIVDQYLKLISYGADDYASQIRLPAYERAEVIADPLRGFGQPIFAHGAASLNDVLQRFWAGDDIDTLSEEFGVPVPEIEDVLRAASRRAA